MEIEQIELPSPSSSPDNPGSPLDRKEQSEKKSLRKSGKPYQFVPSACQICLGKATGHHYDVPSCNGCKSFFRRVTIEKLKYKCQVENPGRCYENLTPGNPAPKCRACRYKKCTDMGMNPLGIQSELKKHSERKSTSFDDVENLEKLERVASTSGLSGKEIVVLPRITEPPKSIEAQVTDLIQHLMRLDLKTEQFRDCTYNPTTLPPLKDVVKDEVSIIGLGDRLGPMPGWPLSQELVDGIRSQPSVPGKPKVYPSNMKRWIMYDILTIVEMAKTFDFFKKLSESDRYFLCRDTALMVNNLSRAYFCYEKKSDKFIRPDGSGVPKPPTWLPQELVDKLFCDIGRRAMASLFRLKLSKIEFLLLRAILLCNSSAPEITNEARDILSKERSKYTMALLNYVMANHGPEGPGRFGIVLNVIDVLERQQKDQRDVNVLVTLYRPAWVKIPLLDDVMLTC